MQMNEYIGIREGGVVDGEQYYVVSVSNTAEHGDSIAITGEQLKELFDGGQEILSGDSTSCFVEREEGDADE
jgi:hypothetical protein